MTRVEQIRPLKIGLIAYNRKQAELALRDFVENNEEQIVYFSKDNIKLKDGTIIHALHDIDNSLRGLMLDQLMLCDDCRWNVIHNRSELIKDTYMRIYNHSCVPDDYIIMKYELGCEND